MHPLRRLRTWYLGLSSPEAGAAGVVAGGLLGLAMTSIPVACAVFVGAVAFSEALRREEQQKRESQCGMPIDLSSTCLRKPGHTGPCDGDIGDVEDPDASDDPPST